MAAKACGAVTADPSSGAGGLPPYQVLGLAQPGQTGPSQDPQPSSGDLNGLQRSSWRPRSSLLQGLGALHLSLGMLTLVLGSVLAATVGEVHLVVQRCWYPFWGAASFLASGASALMINRLPRSSPKTLCLVANLISFLFALAGLFVLSKDLFLETPYPWPFWTPYPSPTAYLQRLELVLLYATSLELLLPGPTALAAHRWHRQSAADGGGAPPAPSAPLELTHPSPGPLPSYEEVMRADP
ncbi:PREDICTED: membrane-spanning 4-domains subfamily A member 10 [Chinchilla lanigera]|uniref:Membrane-spanning 4-domains subfamily A member 10 n=1 Tax=Chinchilla lanigera TaxID=34839 RepID=A0A8C2UY13_CHILA|nr:PREDICTED: membrane-spanning 4-domains subfamily A member 10 [Chinchilla lanigera]